MRRVYRHYELWEDYRAGMYAIPRAQPGDATLIGAATRLLTDCSSLHVAMRAVAFGWPHAAEVNLTNPSRNRQAWLGQASCCYSAGVPEHLTKAAWWTLTMEQRAAANAIADRVLLEWEVWYRAGLEVQRCLPFAAK